MDEDFDCCEDCFPDNADFIQCRICNESVHKTRIDETNTCQCCYQNFYSPKRKEFLRNYRIAVSMANGDEDSVESRFWY